VEEIPVHEQRVAGVAAVEKNRGAVCSGHIHLRKVAAAYHAKHAAVG